MAASVTSFHPPSCVCAEHPLPAAMRVREARDHYLAENGFTCEGYDAPKTDASFLGIRFSVPNTPVHSRAIRFHDLHHVATGFGTDIAGEGEISVWEARRGFRGLDGYVSAIIVSGAIVGAIVAPIRAWRARARPDGAGSLFEPDTDYDALLDLTVGELRELLGVPRDGLAVGPRALHAYAPAVVAA